MEEYYHLNHYHIDKPLSFGGVSLVQLGRIFCKGDSMYQDHVHLNWFELTVVTEGEGRVGANGVETAVCSGDIFLSLPADVHRVVSSSEKPLKYDFFSFIAEDETLLAELNSIRASLTTAHERVFNDKRVGRLVGEAIDELSKPTALLHERLMHNLFERIIISVIRAFKDKKDRTHAEDSDSHKLLCYRIMNYIDTHIFEMKNLYQVSEELNYNYSYLSDLFSRTTGQTLWDYYRNSRMKAARLLLEEEQLSVSRIAELLGYSSVYVFSRAYKTHYGKAPLEHRKSSASIKAALS